MMTTKNTDLCFHQAPIKIVKWFECIKFKRNAIGRVINVATQIFEFLKRDARKISEYVKRRNGRLKLDFLKG